MLHNLVYKITQISTGRTYIGQHQTDNIDDDYWGSGADITQAVKFYGTRDFTFFYVDLPSAALMDAVESLVVTTDGNSFNKKKGGQGVCKYRERGREHLGQKPDVTEHRSEWNMSEHRYKTRTPIPQYIPMEVDYAPILLDRLSAVLEGRLVINGVEYDNFSGVGGGISESDPYSWVFGSNLTLEWMMGQNMRLFIEARIEQNINQR